MKLRFATPIAFFLLLCSVFGWMLYRIGAQGYNTTVLESPLIGKRAPAFTLPRVENMETTVDTRDFAGKPYVVNVWATWCVECRHEHPVLLEIARRNQIPIIGLDTKDELVDAQRWLQTLGNPYVATAFDAEGRVALDWGVYGAPETFLVDAQGNIAYKHVGTLTMQVWERHFLPRIANTAAMAGDK